MFNKLVILLFAFAFSNSAYSTQLCQDQISAILASKAAKEPKFFDPNSWKPGKPRPDDYYNPLEVVNDPGNLKWVEDRNKITFDALKTDPRFKGVEAELKKAILSSDKLPSFYEEDGFIYNFWNDSNNPKGIWRRQSVSEFKSGAKNWEVLLDIDALAKKENKPWVFQQAQKLSATRYIVLISDGGTDAAQLREYDIASKTFIADGFYVEKSKLNVDVIDQDTLLLGVDLGPDTVTDSGYPMEARVWKRGQKIQDAQVIMRGKKEDVSVRGFVTQQDKILLIRRGVDFFTTQMWHFDGQKLNEVHIPNSAEFKTYIDGQMIVQLRQPWSVGGQDFKEADLVAVQFPTQDAAKVELVFRPTSSQAIEGVRRTQSELYLSLLDNVSGKLISIKRQNGNWVQREINVPGLGTIGIASTSFDSNNVFYTHNSFLESPALFSVEQNTGKSIRLQKVTPKFDPNLYEEKQFWAQSIDGTMVPYFVVHKKGIKYDGQNPTLFYGYGGFEISQTPFYSGDSAWNSTWFDRGGVFILANIRGGGEFGPKWHQAAVKENRQRAYDDFTAVIEAAQKSGITSPAKSGIMGGSNGGLLVGVIMTQRPYLLNAVVSQVPLLDMLRYTLMPPGASWIGEYGDPKDPNMAQIIKRYSPFQNIFKYVRYPKVFFVTSTKDDRVNPGHARKSHAKLLDLGHATLLYENPQGGHSSAADLQERVERKTMEMIFLMQQLMDQKTQGTP